MCLEEELPEGFEKIFDSLAIDNPGAIRSVYYLEYLVKLSTRRFMTDSIRDLPNEVRLPLVYEKKWAFYKEQLQQPQLDYIYLYELCRVVENNYLVGNAFISKAIDQIEDGSRKTFMKDFQEKFSASALQFGSPAPKFQLTDASGDSVSLEQLKGKTILLSFWASWCRPCYSEFSHENALHQELLSEDFELVGICLGTSREGWKQDLVEHGLKFRNLYADEGAQKKIFEEYQITSLPHYCLIDSKGRIIEGKTLKPSDDRLKTKIEAAIMVDGSGSE